ncbi:MAG: GTPase ObgE [Candidatus Paceibacterota bacterium]
MGLMAFVDELTIIARAGDGGDGVVRFRHEKNREFGGPSGGDGGRGGNVYIKAVRDVHLLARYRAQKEFVADRGEAGKKDGLTGAGGADLDILLPVGSVVTNRATNEQFRLSQEGERHLLLAGGDGGRGNESFKSSTNQAPRERTTGEPGASGEFFIEVELIADIGLIGLPSAGKSSLLNALTKAEVRVGDYPFTTLEPNLGECYGFIIADIPGLIEGAADGRGLGHKFLRHVRRTKLLVHLVSAEGNDLVGDYQTIRRELARFDENLLTKKEIIVLTKTDLLPDQKTIAAAVDKLKKLNPQVEAISLLADDSIKKLREKLLTLV